jgi:hypothetical protein
MGGYGSRLGTGMLCAVLGWAVMLLVAAMINTAFIGILIFWPVYGGTFLLAGLVGAFVAAGIPVLARHRTLLIAAAITVLLFALLPAWFLWVNQGNTRF